MRPKAREIFPGRKLNPLVVIGKAKGGHREDVFKLGRPGWKVILKLSMTLVCYCSWSVLSSPVEGVESPEGCGDDVGCTLCGVENSVVHFWEGLLDIGKARIANTEKRSRTIAASIAKMEILK